MRNVHIFPLAHWGYSDPEAVAGEALAELTREDHEIVVHRHAQALGRHMARMGIPRSMRRDALDAWREAVDDAVDAAFSDEPEQDAS